MDGKTETTTFELFGDGEKALDGALKRLKVLGKTLDAGREKAKALEDSLDPVRELDRVQGLVLRAEGLLYQAHAEALTLKEKYGPSPTRSGGT